MRQAIPALLLLIISSGAIAAKIDPAYRDSLVEQCVSTYQGMKDAPAELEKSIAPLKYRKDAAKLKEFCACQTDMYHEQIPQADYDTWMKEVQAGKGDGPGSKKVYSKATERADLADKKCDEKMSK